ncbi:high choriolytic enzyme 2-like [Leuresthes tenuis]|uniref:high choriolytic enzyme 2-like n=1 Tax=Leuresthes tenuis TaxID=355514 RepID=UPI003B503BA3
MTVIMTPVFLLLFLSMTAVPLSAQSDSGNEIDESTDVSEIISKANADIRTPLTYGDIVPSRSRNAVPCTASGCKWPKRGRYVYVPITISSAYSRAERNIIIRGLVSFHRSTCIRFVWRRWWNRSYLNIFSGDGCWSYLGRQRGRQNVSLRRNGCLFQSTVQHEVLHALGFHHEQVRSDRDQYVQILTQNIRPGREHNFEKTNTNNLGTPYDFNSVMHYSKFAFSRNGQPTIVAKSDPNLNFGNAREMSTNDIALVNRLYRC